MPKSNIPRGYSKYNFISIKKPGYTFNCTQQERHAILMYAKRHGVKVKIVRHDAKGRNYLAYYTVHILGAENLEKELKYARVRIAELEKEVVQLRKLIPANL